MSENQTIYSMTGYGKHTVTEGGFELTIELKSVNNRYLDINCRVPKSMARTEDIIRRTLKNCFARGSVDVYVSVSDTAGAGNRVRPDTALAGAYYGAAQTVADVLRIPNNYSVADLMRVPDMIKSGEDASAVIADETIVACALSAAEALNSMRQTEGEALRNDLSSLCDNIVKSLKSVEKRAPDIVVEHKNKLQERIKELLGGAEVDEARLLVEAAMLADKLDIHEEISRLKSHIKQFNDVLFKEDGQKGRKLDFLTQEMNREINTIGSKCNDITLSKTVIAMKNELEKIREQVRNVE